jgi:glycosyltransferase involved in cell wall biosynthesis
LISGERIRNYHLLRELSERGWHLTLFSLSEAPPRQSDVAELESLCESVYVQVFRSSSLTQRARTLRNMALGRAFHKDFFRNSETIASFRRAAACRHSDVVYVSQLYMYCYAKEAPSAPLVFDSVNAEELRMAVVSRRLSIRALAARLQLGAVRKLEQEAAAAARRVFAVSPEERAHFEETAPGRVDLIPNGVDIAKILPREIRATPTRKILFLGSLNYSANVDALKHLIEDILPLVRNRDAELVVVGSQPGRRIFEIARGHDFPIRVVGQVPDVAPHLHEARLLVVPLREGAGTRVKVLEALAYGVPVVSTTIGCEGLGLSEREIVIADEDTEFAGAIDRVLSDDDLCEQLSLAGRAAVESRFDWAKIGATADQILLAVATGSRGPTDAASRTHAS